MALSHVSLAGGQGSGSPGSGNRGFRVKGRRPWRRSGGRRGPGSWRPWPDPPLGLECVSGRSSPSRPRGRPDPAGNPLSLAGRGPWAGASEAGRDPCPLSALSQESGRLSHSPGPRVPQQTCGGRGPGGAGSSAGGLGRGSDAGPVRGEGQHPRRQGCVAAVRRAGEERVGQTLQGPRGKDGGKLSPSPGEPREELPASGLCGPLCCSVGRPAGRRQQGSRRQERVAGRGRQTPHVWGFEGVW